VNNDPAPPRGFLQRCARPASSTVPRHGLPPCFGVCADQSPCLFPRTQAIPFGTAGTAREQRARLRSRGSRCVWLLCALPAGCCPPCTWYSSLPPLPLLLSLPDSLDAAPDHPDTALACGMACSLLLLHTTAADAALRGTVTYLDIHDDPTMTIGIFQLPPGARMPLHDHPGMTVFSRLLYGTLHVRAYDWLDSGSDRQAAAGAAGADSSSSNSSSSSGGGGNNSMDSAADGDCAGGGSGSSSTCTGEPSLMGISGPVSPARLVTDRVLTAPADTMVLFPSAGGNIHAFTAISPCAILDVLTPPYGDRNCTYYREVFPPQWLDAAGQPALVPSEEVAAWVAWQQASDDTGELHVSEQQQQQQSGQGGRFGVAGRDDIMVGLEVWREPADFHVTRGTYTGQRLTLAGSGSSGQPP
jgi:PCO_ADO